MYFNLTFLICAKSWVLFTHWCSETHCSCHKQPCWLQSELHSASYISHQPWEKSGVTLGGETHSSTSLRWQNFSDRVMLFILRHNRTYFLLADDKSRCQDLSSVILKISVFSKHMVQVSDSVSSFLFLMLCHSTESWIKRYKDLFGLSLCKRLRK